MHTDATTTPAGTHSHKLPRSWLAAYVGVAAVEILLAALILLVVMWVVGLRADRLAEQQKQHEETRQAICSLLDQFPPSALLDGPRQKFGCGPGTPLDQLPPSVRQQFGSTAQTVPTRAPQRPAAPSQASQPVAGAQATPVVPSEAPVPPRPSGAPAPTSSAAPSPDPLLCRLVPLCSEVP